MKLSAKGRDILDALAKLNLQMAETLIKNEGREMETAQQTLRHLERRWTDAIRSESHGGDNEEF